LIRIVIADDHAIVREGLKRILGDIGDMLLVEEAEDGAQVIQRVREVEFDVLVLDLSMPGRSGLELIRQVKLEKPRVKVLVLSMHHESQYAVRAIKSGANGYLTKGVAPSMLEHAIRKVAAGGAYISAEVAEQLALGAMPWAQALPHDALSDREFQVLRMLANGRTVTDIGNDLHLSIKTVSTHKANLMHKLGLKNQAELVRYAIKYGLVDP
jgi:DNA-binding NarL/FixJ family response regulator